MECWLGLNHSQDTAAGQRSLNPSGYSGKLEAVEL